jgi:hypothetical protein
MELITPEAYKRQFENKDLNVIIEEKKRVETILSEIEGRESFGQKPNNIQQQNALDTSFLAQIENANPDAPIKLEEKDLVQVATSGENSEKGLFMTYQRILNELIKEKNEFMDEASFKEKLNKLNPDELMIQRNKLVEDINKYYKEINAMRTKNMLMSLPFTKWLVKNKSVNENTDSMEVIMKKEEYVKYIEELQADPNHFAEYAKQLEEAQKAQENQTK